MKKGLIATIHASLTHTAFRGAAWGGNYKVCLCNYVEQDIQIPWAPFSKALPFSCLFCCPWLEFIADRDSSGFVTQTMTTESLMTLPFACAMDVSLLVQEEGPKRMKARKNCLARCVYGRPQSSLIFSLIPTGKERFSHEKCSSGDSLFFLSPAVTHAWF